jgi:hypothetical protein
MEKVKAPVAADGKARE